MYAMKTYGKRIKLFGLGVASLCLALLAAGCSKSYPGMEYDDLDEIMIGSQETFDALPILLAFNEYELDFTTRAIGPIDPIFTDPKYMSENSRFYLYAFRAPNHVLADQADYSRTYASDKNSCLIDGTHGRNLYPTHGKPLQLGYNISTNSDGSNTSSLSGNFEWAADLDGNKSAYYNMEHQDYKYDFFVYHVDDLIEQNKVTGMKRSADSISFNVEIDGRQDLIYGVATPSDDWLGRFIEKHDRDESVKEMLAYGIDNYLYSTILANRGVNPNFNVSHALTRFTFHVKKKHEDASGVKVRDIRLSAPNKGRFTVVHKDRDKIGFFPETSKVFFHLPERDETTYAYNGSPIGGTALLNPTRYDLTDVALNEEIPVGYDLMLPSMSEYALVITCEKTNPDKPGETILFDVYYNLSKPDKTPFEAGKTHAVSISVYGMARIDITVDGLTWVSGGDIYLDEEEEHWKD